MDADAFLKNERANEYEARFQVRGEVRATLKAGSLDEAKAKAQKLCEGDEFGFELDDVSDVDSPYVWKTHPMFLVTRDGKAMQVSHLKDGDLPRQPDERGF